MDKAGLKSVVQDFRDNNCKFISARLEVIEHLNRLIRKPPEFVIFDVETTGLDPWAGMHYLLGKNGKVHKTQGARVFAFGLGIYLDYSRILLCLYIPMNHRELVSKAQVLLFDRDIMKVGHNIKFDLQMAYKSGLRIKGDIYDTLTATRLTHDREPRHSLKYLGNKFSGQQGEATDRWEVSVKSWLRSARAASTRSGNPPGMINYSFVPDELIIPYTLADIFYTFLIYQLTEGEIHECYRSMFKLEIEYIWIVIQMERQGVEIDRAACKKAIAACHRQSRKMLISLKQVARSFGNDKFLPSSHQQVKKLVRQLGATDSQLENRQGRESVDAYVLTRLLAADPKKFAFVESLIAYRTCIKLEKTYFLSMLERSDESGSLHCQIRPSDTATGRSASVEPNLQNIPRITSANVEGIPSVRSMFIPRRSYDNWYFDYSQIEMRMFALFCQEPAMLAAIAEGRDLHTETASLMYGQISGEFRQYAKAINFGIIYGMGIGRLAVTLGIRRNEASNLMMKYYLQFPRIKQLLQKSKALLIKPGYVEDMFGRRYHIPVDKAYIVVNSLVQGSSANVLKLAILQVNRLIRETKSESHLLLPIHDELIIEIKKSERSWLPPLIQLAMEEILPVKQYKMDTLVEASSTSENWEDKEETPFPPKVMKKAKQTFAKLYDKVVYKYKHPKVTWFMED